MEKYLRILLLPLISFLLLFLLSGFHNRLASDDFEFLYRLNSLGFSGSIVYFYDSWNTRWAAIALMNLVFFSYKITGTLFWYHLISIAILYFSFFRICHRLLDRWPKGFAAVMAGLTVMVFYYSCFTVSDVFFWINTSSMYLFGTIALLLICGELLQKRNTAAGYLILVTASVFAGASYEPVVLTMMISIVIFLLIKFIKQGGRALLEPPVLKGIVCLSFLMISFAVSYAGQGHFIRAGFLPQTDFFYRLQAFGKALMKMFLLFLPVKFAIALLVSSPWFLLAAVKPVKFINLRFVLWSTVAMIFLVMTALAPVVFIMSEMGPERAWTQISVFLSVYTIILVIYAGNRWGRLILRTWVPYILILFILVFVLSQGVISTMDDANYSASYDERMLYIKNRCNTFPGDTIKLQPLPLPGTLHSAELTPDPAHHINYHLKNYLQIDCELVVEE